MPNKTKVGYGQKANIPSAIETEKLNEMDIIVTSDTDEIAFVDPNKEVNFLKSRTSKAYTLNGTSLGSLVNGSTIPSGCSIDDLLNLITQKAIPATYTRPTLAVANNGGTASGSYEAGTTITPKVRVTFTKNDSKGLTSINLKKGSEEVATGTTSPLDYVGDSFVLGDETVSFGSTAQYQEAITKQNNLGEDSKENWFGASSATAGNFSFVGQRNLFYGTGVGALSEINSDMVRGLANKKLNPAAGTTFTINVAVGQQYIVFAYPATLRDVNNVTYVEANDSGMASNFTKVLVDVADARGESNGLKSYKVFSYEMAVPAAAAMTFTVKI